MNDNIFIDLVANVGFPIFMCIYLMRNFNKTVKELTESVNKLLDRIDRKDNNV